MQTAHGGLYVHHVCRTAGKPTKPAPYYSIDVRQMPSYSGPSFVVSLAHLPINHLYKPPISRLVIFFSPGVQSPFHLESRLHFLQFTTHPADVFLDQRAKRCTSRSATFTAVRAEQLKIQCWKTPGQSGLKHCADNKQKNNNNKLADQQRVRCRYIESL